jgi:hypothetical protein
LAAKLPLSLGETTCRADVADSPAFISNVPLAFSFTDLFSSLHMINSNNNNMYFFTKLKLGDMLK